MIPRQNLHTHTTWDDGKNTPAEMAQAALAAGLTSLGFSAHAPAPYENDWCLHDADGMHADIARVREEYRGRLTIFDGLEWDIISPQDFERYDYVIGSVHHITVGGEYGSIDDTLPLADDVLNRLFGGDKNAMLQAWFAQYSQVAENPHVDIVGHFDLITKFNRFDEGSAFYRDCAMAALENLIRHDKIFEVNTGAMARGYRKIPYPAPFFLRELRARGTRLVLTSDSHSADTVTYAFADTQALLSSLGFRELWYFDGHEFIPQKMDVI